MIKKTEFDCIVPEWDEEKGRLAHGGAGEDLEVAGVVQHSAGEAVERGAQLVQQCHSGKVGIQDPQLTRISTEKFR